MKRDSADLKYGGISDRAVQAKTGKRWSEWFKILDKAGARKLDHKSIAAFLYTKYPDTGPWWSQMITVGYEQARGLREVHQTAGGFVGNASKTIKAPINRVFAAWTVAKTRSQWLAKAKLTITTAAENKSLRIVWGDGSSRLDVNFYSKAKDKTLVAVQHEKLKDAKQVQQMKEYWKKRLEVLKEHLEGD